MKIVTHNNHCENRLQVIITTLFALIESVIFFSFTPALKRTKNCLLFSSGLIDMNSS